MPIDYSRFDNIGSDDDDEDDRHGSGNRGGTSGVDFQKLFQQLQQAESKDDARGSGSRTGASGDDFQKMFQQLQRTENKEDSKSLDPGELPNLYAAAGLGGTTCSRRKGAAPPPAASGMGFGLDPFAYEDGLDDGLGASRALDFAQLRAEAWELLSTRLVTLPGPAEAVPRILLLEAEVQLLASRYRQALIAAMAVQLATEGMVNNRTPDRPYGDWTASTFALEMVCSYQLGDRDHAMQLRETLKTMDLSFMSEHLAARFKGTCEVMELVPAFLNLLKASEQEKQQDHTAHH